MVVAPNNYCMLSCTIVQPSVLMSSFQNIWTHTCLGVAIYACVWLSVPVGVCPSVCCLICKYCYPSPRTPSSSHNDKRRALSHHYLQLYVSPSYSHTAGSKTNNCVTKRGSMQPTSTLDQTTSHADFGRGVQRQSRWALNLSRNPPKRVLDTPKRGRDTPECGRGTPERILDTHE